MEAVTLTLVDGFWCILGSLHDSLLEKIRAYRVCGFSEGTEGKKSPCHLRIRLRSFLLPSQVLFLIQEDCIEGCAAAAPAAEAVMWLFTAAARPSAFEGVFSKILQGGFHVNWVLARVGVLVGFLGRNVAAAPVAEADKCFNTAAAWPGEFDD